MEYIECKKCKECKKPATKEYNGEWYCDTHYPDQMQEELVYVPPVNNGVNIDRRRFDNPLGNSLSHNEEKQSEDEHSL